MTTSNRFSIVGWLALCGIIAALGVYARDLRLPAIMAGFAAFGVLIWALSRSKRLPFVFQPSVASRLALLRAEAVGEALPDTRLALSEAERIAGSVDDRRRRVRDRVAPPAPELAEHLPRHRARLVRAAEAVP